MKILCCKTADFGGANYLIERYYQWLKRQGIYAESIIVKDNIWPQEKHFDMVVIPCYAMNDVYALKKKGYTIDRMLLWDMGAGCFQDGYYNPTHTTGIKGMLTGVLRRQAQRALECVTERNALIFTDVIGRYNTYKEERYTYAEFENENLAPIGIPFEAEYQSRKRTESLKVCWVGRVALDFKYIPLIRAMRDLDEYCKRTGAKVVFSVVGTGDALELLKNDVKTISYPVEFIEFVEYGKLHAFFETQDLAFVMGTSALDAARSSCPAVVVTSIRPKIDPEDAYYRWIYESKGYSLSEFPGLDKISHQVMKSFDEIMSEFFSQDDIGKKCFEYAKIYDEDIVFQKLLNRKLPEKIDKALWKHIRKYYYLKRMIRLYTSGKH